MSGSLWTLSEGSYIAEASTLEIRPGHTPVVRCPVCQWRATTFDTQRDKDGDVVKWVGRCTQCRTRLVIFND